MHARCFSRLVAIAFVKFLPGAPGFRAMPHHSIEPDKYKLSNRIEICQGTTRGTKELGKSGFRPDVAGKATMPVGLDRGTSYQQQATHVAVHDANPNLIELTRRTGSFGQ
jgi:hypothetical protein